MTEKSSNYKMLVLTRRLKSIGVVETMSEQVPDVREAFMEIHAQLNERLEIFGEGDWKVISHSHNIYNGILIVSFLISG